MPENHRRPRRPDLTGAKKLAPDRGVGSGTAELIGVFFDRRFDGIERDGTNNENGHRNFRFANFDCRSAESSCFCGPRRGRDIGALQQARDNDDALLRQLP